MNRRLRKAIRQRHAPVFIVKYHGRLTPEIADQMRRTLLTAAHPARIVMHDDRIDLSVLEES